MTEDTDTVEVEIPSELRERVDECVEERGFQDSEHFILTAVRDAVMAESDLTDEAREQIREAREAYDEGEVISLEEAMDELGLEDSDSS